MKRFIETNPGLMILIGSSLGLVLPGLEYLPSWSVMVVIAGVIFLSCFGLELNDFKSFKAGRVLYFYIVRFWLLPFAGYYLLYKFDRVAAASIMLLFALPAGISTPALSHLFGGNVALGMVLALLSHVLCPLSITFISQLTAGTELRIDYGPLFITLCITVFVPLIIFYLLRGSRFSNMLKGYSKFGSVLLISFLGTLIIGQQRGMLIDRVAEMPFILLIVISAFIFLFCFGWLFARNLGIRERISCTIGSGFNSNALGVGIAMLYFSRDVSLYMIMSEVPWCLAPSVFSLFLKKRSLS